MVKILYEKWISHLNENKMSYLEHFRFAFFHGVECIKAGIYLCVHATFPCFYRHAGSDLVHKLDKVFTDRENSLSNNTGEQNG